MKMVKEPETRKKGKGEIKLAENRYTIGEISEKTGVSIRTLHYYEEIGLLQAEKEPASNNRIYSDKDIIKLQKIISLKYLGYSLKKIKEWADKPEFDANFLSHLQLQKAMFLAKIEEIEQTLMAIETMISIINDEEEVDSTIIMSLIYSMKTEPEQRLWLEKHLNQDTLTAILEKFEKDKLELNKVYIHFSKKVKELAGTPVDQPEVQDLIRKYMKHLLELIGPDHMQEMASLPLREIAAAELERLFPSPFTKEEDEWLNNAMEYFVTKNNWELAEQMRLKENPATELIGEGNR